ncbi:MAG: endonuclease III [Clostridia bacterium]|nr:endonuclease III [Clostridia bacterium]
MTKKQIIEIIEILKKAYPDAKCSLNFNNPFELAIAVMLSAQCTDERVNKTTPLLFSRCKTPSDFINMEISELEKLILPCGFHKTKAKHIKEMSAIIEEKFNGKLPDTMEELISLPGIGRKSANVIMLDAFNKPQGIAVDTHVKRISNRIGFSKETNPEKIEKDLLKIIPNNYLKDVNHLFILHGRAICKSQNPDCTNCPIKSYCKYKLNKKI